MTADEPVPSSLEERVERLELELEHVRSTVSETLAELREIRAEIRGALGFLIRGEANEP